MPSSGSGTVTPVVGGAPTTVDVCPNYPETYLSIEEYWQFLQINEIAGYGIRNFPSTGLLGMGCGDYWNYRNRYYLLSSIQKAKQRLFE